MSDGVRRGSALPVLLEDADSASGLADMLHQYLTQTLARCPDKVEAAELLAGNVVFRSAEDAAVRVQIVFAKDHIELLDGARCNVESPSVEGDFLSVAHLTSGRESPLGLVLRRKLRVRFSPTELPFLLRVLRLMSLEPDRAPPRWRWVLAASAATAVSGATVWYFLSHF